MSQLFCMPNSLAPENCNIHRYQNTNSWNEAIFLLRAAAMTFVLDINSKNANNTSVSNFKCRTNVGLRKKVLVYVNRE